MGESRCWGCCQENCGYSYCTCSCHGPSPLDTDCPKGIHVAQLKRCVVGEPGSAEYWCRYCYASTDEYGHPVIDAAKCPCKKHRTYKAKRKPTTGCEDCWRFYIKMNP